MMMAKVTLAFGVILVLLGGIGYIGTGSVHPTALIPCWFGLVLCIAGALANTEDSKKRMLWMHIAVTVGLLGFIGTAAMLLKALVSSGPIARPVAAEEQGVMGLLCAIYVGLCVRSFIAARRSRNAAA
jgi:hypothetical protein